jgi:hypothetical protein
MMFHHVRHAGVALSSHQRVHLVGHQRIGMHSHRFLGRICTKPLEEAPPISVVEKHRSSVNPAQHHVHRITGGGDASASGHGSGSGQGHGGP